MHSQLMLALHVAICPNRTESGAGFILARGAVPLALDSVADMRTKKNARSPQRGRRATTGPHNYARGSAIMPPARALAK